MEFFGVAIVLLLVAGTLSSLTMSEQRKAKKDEQSPSIGSGPRFRRKLSAETTAAAKDRESKAVEL
jgi:hypothetical protein